MRRLALTLAVLPLVLVAAPAARANRPDSDAPAGAQVNWLPQETWVMERLLPFDEARLHQVLGTRPGQMRRWLRNDDRTVAMLAKRQGVSTRGLADRLLAPRRHSVSPRTYRTLRARTARVLSQGHLAQHVFGHVFHQWSVGRAPQLFGASRREKRLARCGNETPTQLAAAHGVPQATLRARVLAAVDQTGRAGLRAGDLSRAQAAARSRQHRERINGWLNRPMGAGMGGPGSCCC